MTCVDESNLPLIAVCTLPVGPGLSAAIYALHHRRDDITDLKPASLFWRGYRLNLASASPVWTAGLAWLSVVTMSLAHFRAANVPTWWAAPLALVGVVAMYLIKDELPGRLEAVAERGGSVVVTYLSGRSDESNNAFLTDVPGPLAPLMGVRVDEWDARKPHIVNPVRLHNGERTLDVESRLIFELVIPEGAEVMGTYQADFYADTAAVTRNRFGQGHGWYVGAELDQAGVSWVVRQVLAAHDLHGPYPDVADLETTVRVTPNGDRLRFLPNHGAAVEVPACCVGVELLTGRRLRRGQPLQLSAHDVLVVREDD